MFTVLLQNVNIIPELCCHNSDDEVREGALPFGVPLVRSDHNLHA
jgi:hypothetical protein